MNILNDHLVKLVETNQILLDELLAEKKVSIISKIDALRVLTNNAQALKDLTKLV
jgi:hypothetical protein